jgi:hypothetical protein
MQQAWAGLPQPPPDFTWVRYRNVFLLKPVGWHEHSVPDSGEGRATVLGAWAMSPEEFSQTQQFLTGLTVQVIGSASLKYGLSADKVALMYLKPFVDAHKREDVLMFSTKEGKPYSAMYFRYRDAPPGKVPIIVHKSLMVSTGLDSVHVFTFESPEETFAADLAKFGTPILEQMLVVPRLPADE